MSEAKIGFELRKIQVPLGDILPLRHINDPVNTVRRYKAILVSVQEIGLIEPLMVYPQKNAPGKYLLLDGHLRLLALKELGHKTAECIVASEDECFTYNARVSRLSPIQEHKMIRKAVEKGVKSERIAAALNIPVRVVNAYLNLLSGIHPEAANLLKDKQISTRTLGRLRSVSGLRQIEIAELLVAADNYSTTYVDALILGTPKDQLNPTEKPKKHPRVSPENLARMKQEMEVLERDFKAIETGYGESVLNLTLARAYVRKLLNNPAVVKFLTTHYADLQAEFTNLVAAETL